jgi:hypothetical protein
MFSRDESSRIRQEFWTIFGRYMRPIPSAEGVKINWVNYHTGIKDVYFRMEAGPKSAMISISIEHNDPGVRKLYFEQFREFESILHTTLEETWEWELHVSAGVGRKVSRIRKELPDASVFNRNDWPELISFFKPRIIKLDSFWSDAKYTFEAFRF